MVTKMTINCGLSQNNNTDLSEKLAVCCYLTALVQERVPNSEEHFGWNVVNKYGEEPVKCEQ